MSILHRRRFLSHSMIGGVALSSGNLPYIAHAEGEDVGPTLKQDRVFRPFDFVQSYDDTESEYFKTLGLDSDLANGPWEMLLATLGKYVSGGDPKNVQMVTAPRPADWNDKKFGSWRLSKVLGDSMPKWGSSFQPITGNSFGSEYAIYITNIAIPVPNNDMQGKINVAKQEWVDAVTAQGVAISTSGDRWSRFNRKQQSLPPSKRKDFDWWYANLELKYLRPKEDDVKLKGQKYASLISKAGGGWQEVANIVNSYSELSAKYLVSAEGAEDDRKENVYRYLVGQSLDDFIFASKKNNPQKIQDYDQHTLRKHVDQTSWGGNASYGFFVRVSGGGESSHINWQTSDFSMSFSAKGIQSFDITAGDWFSANLIKMWEILDFQQNGPIDRAIRKGILWGQDGIFSLRTAAVVVAYEPEIVLKLQKADYDRVASSWSGSAGIGIGPFSFGADAGGSREDITFNHGSNAIEAKDKSGVPKIIAVIADVLPKFT